jgi:hypothetical protein
VVKLKAERRLRVRVAIPWAARARPLVARPKAEQLVRAVRVQVQAAALPARVAHRRAPMQRRRKA